MAASPNRIRPVEIPAEYLEPLKRHRAFIAVFCTAAILTSLALTYIASEKYGSHVTILYRPHDITRLGQGDTQAFGSPAPSAPFKIIGQTLQDVVATDSLLRPVVLELGLAEGTEYSGAWYEVAYKWTRDTVLRYAGYAWQLLKFGRLIEEDPVNGAVAGLRANVSLGSTDSYVFVLSVRDKHPKRAAAIVDLLGAKLVRWLRDEERTPGREKREQLHQLLKQKEAEIASIRAEIEALLSENGVSSVAIETERSMERLSALDLDVVHLESEIEESRAKLNEIAAMLELKRGAASRSDGQQYIQPEDFKRLSSQKLFEQIELNGRLRRHDALRLSVALLKVRLAKLPEIQALLDGLNTRLQSANREFVLLNDAYGEASVRATVEASEVRVIHAAPIASEPLSPVKIYHVALSALLSLLTAVGLVYLFTFLQVGVLLPSRPPEVRRGDEPTPRPRPTEAHA